MSILKSKQLTGSLNVTSSWAVTASNALSGTSTLSTSLTPNVAVGVLPQITYAAGTSLESIFRAMLVTYIPPTITSLSIRNGASTISTATRDVGNSFIFNTASFSATADNPTSIFPLSSSFTASGADVGTITRYFGDNVLSSTNAFGVGANYTINRATTQGSVTFRVRGKRSDTLANITDATTSIYFGWRNYLAASATIITNDATAQSVINGATVDSLLTSNASWTATCNSDNQDPAKYTYIIYPTLYGNITSVFQNGVNQVFGAFNNIGDYTITNAYSAPISVRVWKSFANGAFNSGDTLTIS